MPGEQLPLGLGVRVEQWITSKQIQILTRIGWLLLDIQEAVKQRSGLEQQMSDLISSSAIIQEVLEQLLPGIKWAKRFNKLIQHSRTGLMKIIKNLMEKNTISRLISICSYLCLHLEMFMCLALLKMSGLIQ